MNMQFYICFSFLATAEMNPVLKTVFLILFFTGMFLVVFSRIWIFTEQQFAERFHRPFFLYPIILRKSLKTRSIQILESQFSFYKRLTRVQKRRFRHRLSRLNANLEFHSRDGLKVTEEMRTLIGSTATMMTFGFRDYSLPNLEKIVLYPGPYYSELGGDLHKGEYSPAYKAMAFSWPDFLRGYKIGNDNLNLGIHELSHVIHIKCHLGEDISSQIYNDGFEALKEFLKDHEEMRKMLLKTKYFRAYAFKNEMEFVAVLIECFFETPLIFKTHFPEVYNLVKRMLNFRYLDY